MNPNVYSTTSQTTEQQVTIKSFWRYETCMFCSYQTYVLFADTADKHKSNKIFLLQMNKKVLSVIYTIRSKNIFAYNFNFINIWLLKLITYNWFFYVY